MYGTLIHHSIVHIAILLFKLETGGFTSTHNIQDYGMAAPFILYNNSHLSNDLAVKLLILINLFCYAYQNTACSKKRNESILDNYNF